MDRLNISQSHERPELPKSPCGSTPIVITNEPNSESDVVKPRPCSGHFLRSGDDITTELCVPVEDQKALRLLVPLARLVQLHLDPKCIRIARHIMVDAATATVDAPRCPKVVSN